MSGRADISTFDMARYGLCSMVASCSCHHLHWGFLVSVSLESCPLSGSLRQTKAFFCLTKYLASVFTVLWSNKVPFNSLFYGYAYPKQIIIFHNNLWWSERTGIECINLHLCIEMHVWPTWVIAADKQFIITTCSVTASMQKEEKKEQQIPSPVVRNNNTCLGRSHSLYYGDPRLLHVCGRAELSLCIGWVRVLWAQVWHIVGPSRCFCFCFVLRCRQAGMWKESVFSHWWMTGQPVSMHIGLCRMKGREEGGEGLGLPLVQAGL